MHARFLAVGLRWRRDREPAGGGSRPSSGPERGVRLRPTNCSAGNRRLDVAHAGGDRARPHSTLVAYAESVREGADVLELDVRRTADGVLVVHHDDTVDATTGADGPVAESGLVELQVLDAGCWWSV